MPRDQLSQFYALLEKQIGVSLDHTKQYLLESRLSPIIKHHGHKDLHSLIRQLNQTAISDIHKQVFDALTTNETMFFRDKHVFEALQSTLLPELIKSRRQDKTLRIWCAAVSTGQEAYSMAMLLKESFPELYDWKLQIVGTDISERTLEKAISGIYTETEITRGLDKSLADKYAVASGKRTYQIKTPLRDMVTFLPLNLIAAWPAMSKFDLVLLRNVMIYFNQETKDRLLERVRGLMNPDAVLVLGAAESIYMNPLFRLTQLERMSYYQAA